MLYYIDTLNRKTYCIPTEMEEYPELEDERIRKFAQYNIMQRQKQIDADLWRH